MPETKAGAAVDLAAVSQPERPPVAVMDIELTPVGVTAERMAAAVVADERPWPSRRSLLLVTVAAPMALVCLYLFVLAAPRYLAEATFIVRAVQSSSSGIGQVAALVEGASFSRADDETYAVNAYIRSRDMLGQLVESDHLRDIFARPEADAFNRFPSFYRYPTLEQFYYHFQHYVDVQIDPTSGLSTLSVQAFTPQDANALANAILAHSEELVNRLNRRAFADAESFAAGVVDESKAHVDEIEAKLTDFRAKTGIVDPSAEAMAALALIQQLSKELNDQETELRRSAVLTPQSATLQGLKEKIESLRTQIDSERAKIVGTDGSLAARLGDFDRLTLERVVASAELESAVDTLIKARQESHQQHLYLELIAAPRSADEANYPRRLLWTVMALMGCLASFTVADTIFANVREHRA
jgi:capsular polysaccharide transport system permease protein